MLKNIKIIVVIFSLSLFTAGCQSLHSRFGIDGDDYADAKEPPTLKLPANAMAVSKRYDIPDLPPTNTQMIPNDMPPDYT